jgi:putative transposase
MPRANRYIFEGQVCHVTHRCHDRAFLLKFARDRDAYRTRLREALQQHDVCLLSYAITSNHVHLLAISGTPGELGRMMQDVAGEFAQTYNRRKNRSGAFWSDRYHATMVDTGAHLWACLRYIDLNMVRAGVVAHPAEWPWTGWHEIMGQRQRFRLLDLDRLLARVGGGTVESMRGRYAAMISESLQIRDLARQPCWTESVAVGSGPFVKQIDETLRLQGDRRQTTVEKGNDGEWVLREVAPGYG